MLGSRALEGVTRESIKPLLDLQRIDSAIDRLHARRANLPEQAELDALVASRAEVAAERAERNVGLGELVTQQNRLENDIGSIDQRRTDEDKRLYSGDVQSPREMQNIQAELDSLMRRKAHLEDEELEIMEQREEVETAIAALDARLADLDAAIADATARRDAATVEIDAELTELASQRAQVAPTQPADVLAFYDELRKKFGGIGVGAFEDGTCRACGLPLSPMARDQIKSSDDPEIRCENCRRLLVIP